MSSSAANLLTKNPRVDVRKRNLDYSKPLTVVHSREDLKKFEYAYCIMRIKLGII